MDTRRIVQRLRVEGLSIEATAVKWVQQWLDKQPDPAQAFEVVIQQLPKATLTSNVLNTDTLNTTISGLVQNVDSELKKHTLVVIPSTSFPHHRYNFSRNGFLPSENGAKHALHGDAKDKIGMFRYRLGLVRQRMLRRESFSAPVLRSAVAEDHLQLTAIDSLLGSSGVRNVLGMLTQLEEGRWYLEDEKGNIPVDLSGATRTAGLFTEGVIVVARGRLEDERFVVEVLGQPLPERKSESLRAFPNIDFFGAAPPPKLLPHLQRAEKEIGDMVVILSDVWLDRPEVMHSLRRLFDGFEAEDSPPRAFIFVGNFSSRGVGHASEDSLSFRAHWDQLADLILQHKKISHPRDGSEFIFVPGPGDPLGAVLPRPPLPTHFTRSIRERLPQVTFATNPCRLRLCTQELLLFREDLMAKMLRHCIVRPTQDTSLSHHLIKTLIDQGHLCPLPLSVRPLHWQLDYTLHIWPLPDLFVLADQYEAFETEYAGCQCRSIASFATDFTFLTYEPGPKRAQWSRIPQPNDQAPVMGAPASAEREPPKAKSAEPSAASSKPAAAPAKRKKTAATATAVQQQLRIPTKPRAKPSAAADDQPRNGKAAKVDEIVVLDDVVNDGKGDAVVSETLDD